jgi:hypothetical protein
VIASTGNELDLVIGVQAVPEELTERVPARDYNGTPFRIWQEVGSFVGVSPDDTVYVADRLSGIIVSRRPCDSRTILPARMPAHADGCSPGRRAEIRAWYRRGGGPPGTGRRDLHPKDTVPGSAP